ncbi:hypothetical protein IAU59_007560 [Kwoniella sp. CBS 9459]
MPHTNEDDSYLDLSRPQYGIPSVEGDSDDHSSTASSYLDTPRRDPLISPHEQREEAPTVASGDVGTTGRKPGTQLPDCRNDFVHGTFGRFVEALNYVPRVEGWPRRGQLLFRIARPSSEKKESSLKSEFKGLFSEVCTIKPTVKSRDMPLLLSLNIDENINMVQASGCPLYKLTLAQRMTRAARIYARDLLRATDYCYDDENPLLRPLAEHLLDPTSFNDDESTQITMSGRKPTIDGLRAPDRTHDPSLNNLGKRAQQTIVSSTSRPIARRKVEHPPSTIYATQPLPSSPLETESRRNPIAKQFRLSFIEPKFRIFTC